MGYYFRTGGTKEEEIGYRIGVACMNRRLCKTEDDVDKKGNKIRNIICVEF